MGDKVSAVQILEKIRKIDETFIINGDAAFTNEVKNVIGTTNWKGIENRNKELLAERHKEDPNLKEQSQEIPYTTSNISKLAINQYNNDVTWYSTYMSQLSENKDITSKIPLNTRYRFIKRVINKLIKVSTRYQEFFNNAVFALVTSIVKKVSDTERNIIIVGNKTNELCDAISNLENRSINNTDLYEKIANLENKIVNNEEKIAYLNEQSNFDFIEFKKDILTRYNTIESKINNYENELKNIKDEIENLSNLSQSDKERIIGIERWLDAESKRITSNEKWLQSTNDRLNSNEKWIDGTNVRIAGDEKWIDELGKRVNSESKDIYTVRSELLAEIKKIRLNSGDQKVEIPAPKVLPSYDQKLLQTNGIKKLNIGCGHITFDDYINIDCREVVNVDVIADVRNLPFRKGEVDEIYGAHIIEHFELYILKDELLPYWRDLLKVGGVLRIVVPNMGAMIEQVSKKEISFSQFRDVAFGGQDYSGNYHYTMFDENELVSLLESVGFKDVHIVDKARKNDFCLEVEVIATKSEE